MKAKRTCKWTCGDKTYLLTKGEEISINKEHLEHAKASNFFDETVKEVKKTTRKIKKED